MEFDFDAVVVGSGFGGSITACSLAEAGRSVLVLERGAHYAPGEFPRRITDIQRIFWDNTDPDTYHGLYELRFMSGIATTTASGVGGGSLIYANNLIRPDANAFRSWPKGWGRSFLDSFYERIEAVLTPTPVPAEIRLVKRDRFRDAAAAIGVEVFDSNQAVSWQRPANPGQGVCVLCAECEFGCNRGAKNTMDFTFLRRAMESGARVRAHCLVSHVEPLRDPGESQIVGYRVLFHDLASEAGSSVTARRLVLSAGTLGTNEILLRSRDIEHTLPNLSPMLGVGFSGNGDFLGSIQNAAEELDPWYGPDVTSVMKLGAGRVMTLAAPTFSRAVMTVLASLGQGRQHHANWFTNKLWPHLGLAVREAFALGLIERALPIAAPGAGPPSRMTNLFALGQDNANGRMSLVEGRLDVQWNYAAENRALIDAMTAAMRAVAEHYGGTFAALSSFEMFEKTMSVHPLGGCRMADDAGQGVVDTTGEVFGYPRLHIADGSVIPDSIGFHPVHTLAAVSLKFADDLVRKSV